LTFGKILIFDQDRYFSQKLWFLTKICIFDKNFDFWPKFRFLTKIFIFDANLDFDKKLYFWPKIRFLTKIFYFWQKFLFLTKIFIFDKNFYFSQKFLFMTKIIFWPKNSDYYRIFRPTYSQILLFTFFPLSGRLVSFNLMKPTRVGVPFRNFAILKSRLRPISCGQFWSAETP